MNSRKLLSLSVLALMMSVNPVASASPKTAKPGAPAEMKLNADMSRLRAFVGEWTCEETYHAGGWVPKEVKAAGVDRIEAGPGGNSLLAAYESHSEAVGTYQAHDIIAYDVASKGYTLFFVDSFSPGYQLEAGKLEGSTLTFSHKTEMNGKKGTFRRVYTFGDNDQRLVVDFVDEAGNVQKLVTITKKRHVA